MQTGNSGLVLSVIKYMQSKALDNIDYVYSIEGFIKKMVDPGEDFPADEKPVFKVDDFKSLFHIVNQESVQNALRQHGPATYTNEMLLFLRVLRCIAYYIIDEPIV